MLHAHAVRRRRARRAACWQARARTCATARGATVTRDAPSSTSRARGCRACSRGVPHAPTGAKVRHGQGQPHRGAARCTPQEHAYILQNADKRIVFVIPFEGEYTPDRHHRRARGRRPSRPCDITEREIDYLHRARPTATSRRPLARSRRGLDLRRRAAAATTTASPTRRRSPATTCSSSTPGSGGEPPVLSIFGGKLTTYRKPGRGARSRRYARTSRRWGRRGPRTRHAARRRPAATRQRAWVDELAERYQGFPRRPARRRRAPPRLRARRRCWATRRRRATSARDFGAGLTAARGRLLRRARSGRERRRHPVAAHQVRAAAWTRRAATRLPRTSAHERAAAPEAHPGARSAEDESSERAAQGQSVNESGARPVARMCLFCGANAGCPRELRARGARARRDRSPREGLALVYGGGSVGLMNEAAEARRSRAAARVGRRDHRGADGARGRPRRADRDARGRRRCTSARR
ncbi:MAG: hypothetical protein MZW92_50620 [Comamonadaceae bacterium]|nr:hypothetical protein [Comamonadaceae bacterium]